jgi:excisionase family DNA binding protein
MTEPMFTVAEAAAWLKISKKSLYALTAARAVPFTRPAGTKHIRFTQAHLDQIAADGYQPPIAAPTRIQVAARRRAGRSGRVA